MSRLYVDRISPYQSASIEIDGLNTSNLTTTASFNSYTSSNDAKVTSLIEATGSYAKTNVNNSFNGDQSFLDISVSGTGSFGYLQSITGSVKNIGDAFIQVNTATPAVQFGGIYVIDSGSFSGSGSGSFQFDSATNKWLTGDEFGNFSPVITGISGPDKDNLIALSPGTLPVASGSNHLVDSLIKQTAADQVVITNKLQVPVQIQTSGSSGGAFAQMSTDDGSSTNFFVMQQSNLGSVTQISQGASDGTQQLVLNKNGAGSVTLFLNGSTGEGTINASNGQTSESGNLNSNFLQMAAQAGGVDKRIILTANASSVAGSGWSDTNPTIGIATGGGLQQVMLFQDASNYTDGTVDMLTPTEFKSSAILSGSLRNEVVTSAIASTTASIDFGSTSLFELELASGAATHIVATNVSKGQNVRLKVKQPAGAVGTVVLGPQFLQESGNAYTATASSNAEDILTFVTFSDTAKIYTSNIDNLV